MTIELLVCDECPHAQQARALLDECLLASGLDTQLVVERRGDHPSPTILVNGCDIMGRSSIEGRACRLDLPTRDALLVALRRALAATR
jgi:hypothetical protein